MSAYRITTKPRNYLLGSLFLGTRLIIIRIQYPVGKQITI